ncbi:MAG: hypothetical protein WCJ41_09245 [Aestuariivirga sp.]|uniref:hypothetical protein n=1 Tax=Aestuariivirga sp. TaxID=2650926 RepID=UPI003017E12D
MKLEDASILWFALGLALGAVSAFQLVAIGGQNNPSEWVDHYQALIGALIAVLAAAITVSAALWTESRRREDRLRSTRAMLPFSLSELTEYSQLTVMRLRSVLPPVTGSDLNDQIVTDPFDPAEFPHNSLEKIQEVIEVAPLRLTRGLAELISKFQVYHSRLDDAKVDAKIRFSSFVSVETVRRCIVEHLELQARVARCYEFARFLADDIRQGPITYPELMRAAQLNKIFDDDELELRIAEHSNAHKMKSRI